MVCKLYLGLFMEMGKFLKDTLTRMKDVMTLVVDDHVGEEGKENVVRKREKMESRYKHFKFDIGNKRKIGTERKKTESVDRR